MQLIVESSDGVGAVASEACHDSTYAHIDLVYDCLRFGLIAFPSIVLAFHASALGIS